MKNITISIFAVITVFIAASCNQSSTKNNELSENNTTATSGEQAPSQSKVNDTVPLPATPDTSIGKNAGETATGGFSIAPIVADYLSLKNALVSDDANAAADAGKKLFATLNKVDMKTVPADNHKKYMDITDDIKENAEHIGDNAGKIDHQREHLASLSEDISDLITLFGSPQALYQDHCPMFNDGKGAIWLSESKAIKNPYYGSKMITCGMVEKTFN
ncbi:MULTISPECIES: DUF3347 domain-containing protein [Flavobacteriales]|jgi:Protein of unknown function (DUF3347)|uniref:DUF3347 domain-containing protein n=2 Tax=Chryseobacterium TaxID=59732 RepID=A0AAJ1R0X5_9FLAO|nr:MULTISPECIES: DUF3347 domain-containing protein [Flavobacteriales]HWV70895.1 DUF3347 domain-containing protein [Pseudosphingobacterium sp.]MBF6645683.1 DUF3347 domain-containing protein [Chryseobacterium indologenes]MBU3049727.1 DUF3347 domain-containing protein [Chryseobacterium indologenes]MDN4011324.1 DUF3347 domain-containing protein [Chryseobacterium gambrini]NML59261.1 DUF3347 domain-containing protein [Chryseobacterium cheonjiense]